ncbi:MAG: nucleotidyltransferase domain-containing protein, partial [Methanophagales archaeon]|nr:nucleotidyltransferase domain-containing protein [Methanophagales archaeon]
MLKRIDKVSKKAIEETIREVLKKHKEILFAYLHGSFVKKNTFHDIDVAVYLEKMPVSVLEYELEMETELMKALRKYTIDVRVLNGAPLSFKYN